VRSVASIGATRRHISLADVRVRTVEEMHLVSGWCRIEGCVS
jgi:hypothetical protein